MLVVALVVCLVVVCSLVGGVWVDRWLCAGLADAVAIYALRTSNGCLVYPGITEQLVTARWAQHANPERMSERGRDFKFAVDYDRSTIIRWARSPRQAARIERRYILAMAFAFRWGHILGLPRRYLGNSQHNRRPRSRREAVCFAAWAIGYEVMGWLVRGEAHLEDASTVRTIPIDGRWLWPWRP